ncbi:MAG: S-methyl-5'-thioadenosine phosphorylase [Deltaproteobacteria bacterium]|nr:S-methyl-5'-thioadenosine phosphorylase [Deltaproteobacteria bacterium]
MSREIIGVIGGSGLYQIEGLRVKEERRIKTPFGEPSDAFIIGELNGVDIAFIARHNRRHTIPPHQINYRANIYGFKLLGATKLISVSAVGSMKEDIKPSHMVVPYQFFDRTFMRARTFFEDGIVAHVSFADAVCKSLAHKIAVAAREERLTVHEGGTYICIEGPTFSTRAESEIYRKWGVDIIGMTNLPEARLAREAEICYATLALSTDYDCWYENSEDVTAQMVIEIMKKNVENAKKVIRRLIAEIDPKESCSCNNSLANSIVTSENHISPKVYKRLKPIIGRYIKPPKKR